LTQSKFFSPLKSLRTPTTSTPRDDPAKVQSQDNEDEEVSKEEQEEAMKKLEECRHRLRTLDGTAPTTTTPDLQLNQQNTELSRVDPKEYNKFMHSLHKERMKRLADKRDLASTDVFPTGAERKVLFKSTVNGTKKKHDRVDATLKRQSSKREEKVNSLRAKLLAKANMANPVGTGSDVVVPETVVSEDDTTPNLGTEGISEAALNRLQKEMEQEMGTAARGRKTPEEKKNTDDPNVNNNDSTAERDRTEAALGLASLLNQDRTLYNDISNNLDQLQEELQGDVDQFGELVAFMTADEEDGNLNGSNDDNTNAEEEDGTLADGENDYEMEFGDKESDKESDSEEDEPRGRGWSLFG
jgi:hypothetical protein